MILKGESADEFNRKADENYEKYKARQKQNLIDMMEADEKLGLYEKPKKLYTIEDIERCVENWGLCKVEREYIEKFLATKQAVKDSLTTKKTNKMSKEEIEHLQWIHDRIISVYGESENVDFLIKMREILNQNKEDE